MTCTINNYNFFSFFNFFKKIFNLSKISKINFFFFRLGIKVVFGSICAKFFPKNPFAPKSIILFIIHFLNIYIGKCLKYHFKTYISKLAINKVKSTIKSTFLNEGKVVKEFEKRISKFIKSKYVNTTSSGTAALHLALACSNIKKGDEVILTPQTFIASGLAVLYVGAKPIFCDIDLKTGNILIESLVKKITKKTKAIIAVHWSGYPCDMNKLINVCKLNSNKKYVN